MHLHAALLAVLVGLLSLFAAGLLAATLLPVGSEPVVIAYLLSQGPFSVNQAASVVLAVGAGNTLGGVITYGMGRGVVTVWKRYRPPPKTISTTGSSRSLRRSRLWLDRWGPAALILSWVPIVGDPLCLVAGGLRLPFWWCVLWMAIGKFARYAVLVWVVLAF